MEIRERDGMVALELWERGRFSIWGNSSHVLMALLSTWYIFVSEVVWVPSFLSFTDNFAPQSTLWMDIALLAGSGIGCSYCCSEFCCLRFIHSFLCIPLCLSLCHHGESSLEGVARRIPRKKELDHGDKDNLSPVIVCDLYVGSNRLCEMVAVFSAPSLPNSFSPSSFNFSCSLSLFCSVVSQIGVTSHHNNDVATLHCQESAKFPLPTLPTSFCAPSEGERCYGKVKLC